MAESMGFNAGSSLGRSGGFDYGWSVRSRCHLPFLSRSFLLLLHSTVTLSNILFRHRALSTMWA